MNIRLLTFACLLASAFCTRAQVSVQILMEQTQFVPDENLPVRVRINNNSGQAIHFGDETWLNYSIESSNGRVIAKNGDTLTAHNFDIGSGEAATIRGNLVPSYTISKAGRYLVTATVQIKDWDKEVSSKPKAFDIVPGTRIWEQEFGLPQSPTNRTPPEVRKYILTQATFVKRMNLYLRLTDAIESRTLRIFSLGPMISFSDPQMQLDSLSNLHLLYQAGAHLYIYSIINTDGILTERQTYVYEGSAPHLRATPEGNILIIGGVRQISDTDLPMIPGNSPTNVIPPPVP